MKLPSGVKLSGPFSSILMPAVPSAGTRCTAFVISGSNCSQSSGSSWNSNFSGMPSMPQGFAASSKPPMTRPPTSSLK